jgi:hypothetical protein
MGVKEHCARAAEFLTDAVEVKDPVRRFRRLLAAVYSARAAVELVLEAADKRDIAPTREQLKAQWAAKLIWYDLIERIRIHDFHRFGLTPPDPRVKAVSLGGPITLRARKGGVQYQVTSTGPTSSSTGDGRVEEQRPLVRRDEEFYDYDSGSWVTLDKALREHLEAIPALIKEFQALLEAAAKDLQKRQGHADTGHT